MRINQKLERKRNEELRQQVLNHRASKQESLHKTKSPDFDRFEKNNSPSNEKRSLNNFTTETGTPLKWSRGRNSGAQVIN